MMNLSGIKFEIMSEKHKSEAIDILSTQFSIHGGGHRAQIFNCKPSDLYPYFSIVIQHAINTKLSYVAIQNNKIIYVVVSFDLFDTYSIPQSIQNNLSLTMQATMKYFGFMESKDQTLKQLRENCKFGEVNYYAFGAISPIFEKGKSLAVMITAMHWIILSDIKTIKYATHSYSHPKSVYYALKGFPKIFKNLNGLQWKITATYNYAQMMDQFLSETQNNGYNKILNVKYLEKLRENGVGWVWAITEYDRNKLSEPMDELWIVVLKRLRPKIFSRL